MRVKDMDVESKDTGFRLSPEWSFAAHPQSGRQRTYWKSTANFTHPAHDRPG